MPTTLISLKHKLTSTWALTHMLSKNWNKVWHSVYDSRMDPSRCEIFCRTVLLLGLFLQSTFKNTDFQQKTKKVLPNSQRSDFGKWSSCSFIGHGHEINLKETEQVHQKYFKMLYIYYNIINIISTSKMWSLHVKYQDSHSMMGTVCILTKRHVWQHFAMVKSTNNIARSIVTKRVDKICLLNFNLMSLSSVFCILFTHTYTYQHRRKYMDQSRRKYMDQSIESLVNQHLIVLSPLPPKRYRRGNWNR